MPRDSMPKRSIQSQSSYPRNETRNLFAIAASAHSIAFSVRGTDYFHSFFRFVTRLSFICHHLAIPSYMYVHFFLYRRNFLDSCIYMYIAIVARKNDRYYNFYEIAKAIKL